MPSTLKKVYEDGYAIAILTNQGRLSLKNDSKTVKADQKSLATFKTKVDAILSHFDFPIILLAATARDQYRKPRLGMWNELLDELDLEVGDGPDLSASFFVGDAAGRPARDNAKADHSCSDRNFAENVGAGFQTPEEYFLHKAPEPYIRQFVPSDYLKSSLNDAPNAIPSAISKKNDLDIILLCGSPAAGKSTFYWTYLRPLGYERVNQDLLRTRDKCVKVAFGFLSEAKSVTIDNTNADVATRAIWIDLASKFKVPIRCVYFTASAKLCEHNDTVRALALGPFNPEKRSILPHSAFAGFAARFKEPSEHEGFQDLTQIDFQFRGGLDESRLWSQYWL